MDNSFYDRLSNIENERSSLLPNSLYEVIMINWIYKINKAIASDALNVNQSIANMAY